MTDESAAPGADVDDVHAYCREVEAHLCRRNGGHLIRVVGPAFDLVKDWAAQGVPLSIVRDGIDRTVERRERKPGRRRPIPVEFCAGDVLDGFDRWRRAVGITSPAPASPSPARGTLHAHVDRVSVQLAALLGSGRVAEAMRPSVQAALTALDGLKSATTSARGAARDALLAQLAACDRDLVAAADASLSPDRRTALQRDAERELDAFRGRLSPAQLGAAQMASRQRALRAALGLPDLRFD